MISHSALLAYPGALTVGRHAPHPAANLTALSLALGAQDPYTQGHAKRVAEYAGRMAARIGLEPDACEFVRLGGLLHDIGKIGFSRKLLVNRNTRLSASMRAEIRRHPEIGFNFLKSLQVSDAVVEGVRYHHERPDGSGYPFGLKTGEIPRSAQIISVADCFDALTTDRPYQKGKAYGHAFALMQRMGPGIFPGELLQALVEDIRENGGARTCDDADMTPLYRRAV